MQPHVFARIVAGLAVTLGLTTMLAQVDGQLAASLAVAAVAGWLLFDPLPASWRLRARNSAAHWPEAAALLTLVMAALILLTGHQPGLPSSQAAFPAQAVGLTDLGWAPQAAVVAAVGLALGASPRLLWAAGAWLRRRIRRQALQRQALPGAPQHAGLPPASGRPRRGRS